jgi:hypothetical protein
VLQGAVSWIAVGWSVGRLVSRTERRAKAGRVPAMFAQGGVDERQQLFVRGRELFNERRRRLSMGADDDEDYNESNNEDCVFPVEELLRAPTAEEVASDGEDDGLEADGASLEPPIAAARVGATAAATEVEQADGC